MKFDYIKEMYEYELERKDKLTDALGFPAGILAAVLGGVSVLGQAFSYADRPLTVAFLVVLSSNGICALVCLVLLARAYHGREYEFVERLGILQKAEQELVDWHVTAGKTLQEGEREFEMHLQQKMIEAADRNALANDQRTGYLYRARIWLFMVLIVSSVAGLIFVLDAVF